MITTPTYRTASAYRRKGALVHRLTNSSSPLTYTLCGLDITLKYDTWAFDTHAATVTCDRCWKRWPQSELEQYS